MSRRGYRLLTVALLVALYGACGKDTHIHVDDSQLIGTWVKSGTQEYWKYDADHNGVTWDESEDIGHHESNLTFTWSIAEDVLTHAFPGEMGNQAVPKVYTITEISGSMMKWKDEEGFRYNLERVNS